jgi:hypothetical protein
VALPTAKPEFVRTEASGAGILDESVFRYFLVRERRRAVRTNRWLVLLLVMAKRPDDRRPGLLGYTAEIFIALAACVREIDFVGWYRDGVVAAAVLTVGGTGSGDPRQMLRTRVDRKLRRRLSAHETALFRVRVVELDRKSRT